jgi:ribosomal protein S27AE
MWNEENSPQRNILPLRRVVSDPPKDERLVSLSDLVYSTSKGKWIIKEEESIPKVEECVNCGVALFHEVEFLLGVCGQCETNLVCPNTENCDADLSVEDFIEKQCSNCGQDLDLLKLIEESNRKVTPSQGATGLVSADVVPDFDDTLPFDETPVLPFSRREQGTQDAKEAITVITRLEVERLAEECQMVIVDYELGE